MTDVEMLDASRKRMFLILMTGFGVYVGFDLLAEAVALLEGPAALFTVAKALGLVGVGILFLGLWRMRKVHRRMKESPELAAVLNDELVRYAEGRSFAVAFKVTLALLAVLHIVVIFVPLPASFVLRLCLLVAALAWSITFLQTRDDPA